MRISLSHFGSILVILISLMFGQADISAASIDSSKGPGQNALSCTRPGVLNLADGQFACYRYYDLNSEFGGDKFSCPVRGGSQKEGCVFPVKLCKSGYGKASKLYPITTIGLNDTKIITLASNLNSTPLLLKNNVIFLWEVQCYNELTRIDEAKVNALVYSVYEGVDEEVNPNQYEQRAYLEIPKEAQGKTLILSSYEGIKWYLRNPNGVSPKKIIVNGYYTPRITTSDASSLPEVEINSYYSNKIYAPYAYEGPYSDEYQEMVTWYEKVGLYFNYKNFVGAYNAGQNPLLKKPNGLTINEGKVYGPAPVAYSAKYNPMSCSRAGVSNIENGEIACYGIWDYGNDFGGDEAMCPRQGYTIGGSTGCINPNTLCKSGFAEATKSFDTQRLKFDSTDMVYLANKLLTTPASLKQNIVNAWEVRCVDGKDKVDASKVNTVVYSNYNGVEVKISDNKIERHAYLEIPEIAEGKTILLTSYEGVKWFLRNPNKITPKKVILYSYYSGSITTSDGSNLPELEIIPTNSSDRPPFVSNGPFDDEYEKLFLWAQKRGLIFNPSTFFGEPPSQGSSIFLGGKVVKAGAPLIGDSRIVEQKIPLDTIIPGKIYGEGGLSQYFPEATKAVNISNTIPATTNPITTPPTNAVQSNASEEASVIPVTPSQTIQTMTGASRTTPPLPSTVDTVISGLGTFSITFTKTKSSSNANIRKIKNVTLSASETFCLKNVTRYPKLIESCSWNDTVIYSSKGMTLDTVSSDATIQTSGASLSASDKKVADRAINSTLIRTNSLSSGDKDAYIEAYIKRLSNMKASNNTAEARKKYMIDVLSKLKTGK